MGWSYFPFDSQTCSMDIASYAFTTEDLVYRWKNQNPIQMKHGLARSLAEFRIQSVLNNYCTSKTSTGEYSCLRASLILERSMGHHLIHFYIPCIALVFLSSLVFWLDKSTTRLMIGLSALFLTGSMTADVNSGLPRVSYLRAIDVWIAACLLFIIFSLVETVMVHYLSRKNVNECKTFANDEEHLQKSKI
uniref:Uncharacterized protein n=1 Tax=Romanomermis culicivorax TaxID=13658 RepID=A0A915J3M1_ROMCU